MNRSLPLTAAFTLASAMVAANPVESKDTTKIIDIEEIVVVASPKENTKLRQQASSVSLLSQLEIQNHQVNSLKNITSLIPNFFMPDYGSRLTSAIYIRGIGSRINTPAVGLYVDNIPYLDKSAFDFNFFDIERIDVLRGPQGTLYGRNTMGGLIKVHTKNPFRHQGTDVKLSAANANGSYGASLTHYHRISNQFAFSAGGFYNSANGFFTNEYLHKKADAQKSGGGRLRAIWLPSDNFKIDTSIGYEYSDEGGYAYGATDKETGKTGAIQSNTGGTYRRSLFHTGIQMEYQASPFIISSVTGYQNLSDRMLMDQDFSPASVYVLEQKQQLNTYSEELSLKSHAGQDWQWVTGTFFSYQHLNTQSPVHFQQAGMTMLDKMINSYLPNDKLTPMGMNMSVQLHSESLPIDTRFGTPSLSMALFHQSTFNNLILKGLSLTVGLRIEHEHMSMRYLSQSQLPYDFIFSSPRMPIELKDLNAQSSLKGKIKNHYTELLPKFALKYDFNPNNNLYVSISRGFRSGGYNLQMFSDLTRNDLSNVMMKQVKEGCHNKLDHYATMGMPSQIVEMIRGYLEHIPLSDKEMNIEASTVYQPEYSWNYELGSHLTLWKGKLQANIATFYMDTRDQQIAKFVDSGLGRIMVNAGRSRSYGVEGSILASVTRNLQFNATYGYTRATFKDYDGGEDSEENVIDYSGNYVPFVPRHTMNIGGSYTFFFAKEQWIRQLLIHADYTGTGEIYWTEANNAKQGFYGLYSGRISAQMPNLQIDLWARNLLNKSYQTFYFESIGTGFAQLSKPRQFGIDIRINF